jgi:F-type H+-transporting ATPase subunit b
MKAHKAHLLLFALLLLGGAILFPDGALAAEEESNKWGIWLVVGRLFNLALVVGVLVWVARKPLAIFYANRTQTIREQLAEAQAARREAEAKLAEMESRMSRLDDELRGIKEQAEQEAQEEYQRLLSAAERDAEKIIERARQEIEGMTRAAQLELKGQVAELSVQLAEEKIRQEITDEDRNRLFSGFVTKLGGER